MENYSKGKNVEEDWARESICIPNLPGNFLWMQVKAGSKMQNLLSYALEEFKNRKEILWSGTGPAISKTISCAEITKRENPGLFQISKICSRKVEEHWEPKISGLAPLIVQRDVPTIHIFLSREPLNEEEPGFQAPGLVGAFWKSSSSNERRRLKKIDRSDANQFQAMGLRTTPFNKKSKGPKNVKSTSSIKDNP